ncbi:MAG TPA: amidohydrolase family protein [bacterium]|nr:amidohydrolase family protein [bacterium]
MEFEPTDLRDLATTVSKFLHLGFSLEDALRKVMATPAQALGMSHEIGTLRIGAWGDAVAFELQEGTFELLDSQGERHPGQRKLVPKTVVCGDAAGELFEPVKRAR